MQVSKEIVEQAKKIRNEINKHNHAYYVEDSPVISDSEYDKLFRKLQELEKKYPQLQVLDSPTQRVGAQPLKSFKSVHHSVAMLSLSNAFTEKELFAFDKRVQDRLKSLDEIEYACEPKLDGLAITLLYSDGVLERAATRWRRENW